MIECPACAGPPKARATCATCNGAMEVTQEFYDLFISNKQKSEKFWEFVNNAQELINNSKEQSVSITINGEEVLTYQP